MPLPTVVGEAWPVERRRFSFSSQLSISGSIAPELSGISRVLSGWSSKPNFASRSLRLIKEAHSIGFQLEAQHKIVGIPNDDDIALCRLPAPDVYPQIEDIMQVHVGQQR